MTTSTLTVTDFVLARLDEVDALPCCDGTGEYSACAEVSERYESMAKAMRKIVELAVDAEEHTMDRLPKDYMRATVRMFASIWSSHPDWREEWA